MKPEPAAASFGSRQVMIASEVSYRRRLGLRFYVSLEAPCDSKCHFGARVA
jgi:hypothetical protein